ncbi:hypothetical protein AAFF_G00013120 [Aldrovandia affinis]|uniref:Uncharacterized protein n=1 Tax=Aldrovandia affinis TaxID=143900 RepID=A0AAD7WI82_9TELE|nr:hypothetical protein AAFF_G00013120 [Aldrovandia affinis]
MKFTGRVLRGVELEAGEEHGRLHRFGYALKFTLTRVKELHSEQEDRQGQVKKKKKKISYKPSRVSSVGGISRFCFESTCPLKLKWLKSGGDQSSVRKGGSVSPRAYEVSTIPSHAAKAS